eukprot:6132753-Pyramimonas_sp.AAC.1
MRSKSAVATKQLAVDLHVYFCTGISRTRLQGTRGSALCSCEAPAKPSERRMYRGTLPRLPHPARVKLIMEVQ